MKQHFCSAENSLIKYEKECNWCGEQEPQIAFNAEVVGYVAPQRTWVGLTDREMMDAIYIDDTPMEMGRKIEAKLKEKNT
jgi:hypothetical protein